MDEAELANLTAEERAALADEPEDEPKGEDQPITEMVDDDDEDDAPAADDAPADPEPAVAKEPAKAEPAKAEPAKVEAEEEAVATATVTDEDDDADPPPPMPTFAAKPVEDYDGKMKALDEREDELAKKQDEGEIDAAEYRKQLREINNERLELREAKVKADLATESQAQASEKTWRWEQEVFFRSVRREEKFDYRSEEHAKFLKHLDSHVKMLAADPDNADRPSGWFLREAHRQVKALYNPPVATAEQPAPVKVDAKAKAEAAVKDQLKARKEATKKSVKGLGDLPAAAENPLADDSEDEFAHLDKLDGLALERELAKMPPDKVEKFLLAQ